LYDLLGHSHSGELNVEPYLITLNADAEPYVDSWHTGVEFIYILSGKVEAPMTSLSIIIYPRRI
jgi:hypothetical protein